MYEIIDGRYEGLSFNFMNGFCWSIFETYCMRGEELMALDCQLMQHGVESI